MTGSGASDIEALRRAEVVQPVAPPIAAISEATRARHGGVAAVLFYGSCLRLGDDEGKIVDLYLVVDSYRAAYGAGLRAFLNWVLPPNVFYIETTFAGRQVRAKYAVVSQRDFAAGVGGLWFHPYLWARFAQPCRLVWCRDEAARQAVVEALCGAVRKCLSEGLDLIGKRFTSEALWVALFKQTYRSELRAEPPERAAEIHAADAAHYQLLAEALLPGLGASRDEAGLWIRPVGRGKGAGGRWALRRVQGKLLSVARLAKAAFTFQGGADYLAWKIERHAGVRITLTPWQHRHPLLASPLLFWRLYRRGAFR